MILIRESQDGDIDLAGHPTLRSFPLRKVRGYLWLGDCTSLCSLPDTLVVADWLGLDGCVSLSRLPVTLRVGRSLYLTNTSVTELPKALEIGYDLFLRGSKVTHVPKSAKIGGHVHG